jgi:fumarate hydratase subunit beta
LRPAKGEMEKRRREMGEILRLQTPLRDEDVEALRIGQKVLLSGVVYTARDAAHRRMMDLIEAGKPLPIDIKGQVIYYVGPAPAKPGRPIGSAGPTTSYRMDVYSPKLLELGLKGMIGKGKRSKEVIDALVRYKGVYFGATGGAGALLARSVLEAEVVAYEDLGPEAIRRLVVRDLPLIVVNDVLGQDLYEEGVKRYSRQPQA